VYNGLVEGLIPLICIIAITPIQWIDWDKRSELLLILCAFASFGLLFGLSLTNNIWMMYSLYTLYRILYQVGITVIQCLIIKKIDVDNGGFVLGLNTFIALVFQTTLSILVTKIKYLNPVRRQVTIKFNPVHLLTNLVCSLCRLSRWYRLYFNRNDCNQTSEIPLSLFYNENKVGFLT
jgi:hypothetical protein